MSRQEEGRQVIYKGLKAEELSAALDALDGGLHETRRNEKLLKALWSMLEQHTNEATVKALDLLLHAPVNWRNDVLNLVGESNAKLIISYTDIKNENISASNLIAKEEKEKYFVTAVDNLKKEIAEYQAATKRRDSGDLSKKSKSNCSLL